MERRLNHLTAMVHALHDEMVSMATKLEKQEALLSRYTGTENTEDELEQSVRRIKQRQEWEERIRQAGLGNKDTLLLAWCNLNVHYHYNNLNKLSLHIPKRRWHQHLNKLYLHIPKDYFCAISKNSVEKFWRRRFSKIYIKFALFKLSLAIIFPIM